MHALSGRYRVVLGDTSTSWSNARMSAQKPTHDQLRLPADHVGFLWWQAWGWLGLTLGNAILISQLSRFIGVAVVLITINSILAVLILRFKKYAFLVATILSLNPLLWFVNGIYLRRRWHHPRVNAKRLVSFRSTVPSSAATHHMAELPSSVSPAPLPFQRGTRGNSASDGGCGQTEQRSTAAAHLWPAGLLLIVSAMVALTFYASKRAPSEVPTDRQERSIELQPRLPPAKIEEPDAFAAASAVYTNSRFAFTVRYPRGVLFPQGESANGDGQVFSSADSAFVLTAWAERREGDGSVQELFDYESRGLVEPNPNLVVTYKRRKGNWFVVSGKEGSVGVYRRVQVASDHVARVEMRWPADDTDRWRATIEQVELAVRKNP